MRNLSTIKQEQQQIISDWSSRQYNGNGKVVSTGNAAWNAGAGERTTVGNANESRRRNVISNAKTALYVIEAINVRYGGAYATRNEISNFAYKYLSTAQSYPDSIESIIDAAANEYSEPAHVKHHEGEIDAAALFADFF